MVIDFFKGEETELPHDLQVELKKKRDTMLSNFPQIILYSKIKNWNC